ncbi:nonribosomal siderophore peptide synthase Sid2 [Venturia nashicola]|uniref:Nonribosomal siderophore peptide synthase Sid2 n=1 Tax=Venturia nashicola TaxID=86259 RepID=A0A4Z1P5P3_9PEZI|nr:nonribosomal siderophore peptide synthase Sid2 [Venturia nashicola]
MGLIDPIESYEIIRPKHLSVELPSTRQACNKDFRELDTHGLISNTRTGIREEVLLVAWLLVLLRTRENGHADFSWGHRDQTDAFELGSLNNKFLMNEVISGQQDSIDQAAQAIYRHIAKVTPAANGGSSSSFSLLLCSNVCSIGVGEGKSEGLIYLEVCLDGGRPQIRPLWHSSDVLARSLTRHVETFVDMVKISIQYPNTTIEECFRPTPRDLDEIWGWNHLLPSSYNFCMHDMVTEQAHRYPDKVAVDSWDGSLTYAQVEHYSTLVACSLKDMGVEIHDIVPICFEKSRWTIVAVLAVMKSGATFVLMDPTLPLARLRNMAEQVRAKSMISSHMQKDLSGAILPGGSCLVLGAETFANLSDFGVVQNLPSVPPSALMYIIFTSGSTGTPKGVQLSHRTYTSSAIPRAQAVGYMENSRVLDFASYAFDVSIDSMLLTLSHGGCLCIPSDEDRLNDINSAIRDMKINYAGLTPSLARILDPDVISSLTALGLGGEAVSARDANFWGRDTRIVIGYGPCECTIGCTINSSAATGRDYISIGRGNGAAMWVVSPDDHDTLMPVGAVGELLVEGPIVGQGYLNDPEKTAAAFIEDPRWLTSGHQGYAGRRGRLYKTGDLGKYDLDGSGEIVFVGRKDSQVKLRGQRVELGEIESQLKSTLPSDINVVAEVITPLDSRGQATLVAFVAFQSKKGHQQIDIEPCQLSDELQRMLSEADTELTKVLPRYMVPNAYIPINHIPVLVSSKTDRKRLKQYGTTVNLRSLGKNSTITTMNSEQLILTEIETRLRHAWGEVLKLDAQKIHAGDNFFALGGDSLTAMRLVSACRAQGLDLSVANTFGNPTLSAMASTVHDSSTKEHTEIAPFSMIACDIESARIEAAQACEANAGDIEDIYPCTPTQESLFTFSLKSVKVYVAQRVARLPSELSIDVWQKAWEDIVSANGILRTRLAQLQEPGLQQVILKESISWRYASNLSQYLENDQDSRMELGQNLARYAIVTESDGKRYMVWTVHHVLYDGWSEPLILQKVSKALQSSQNGHVEKGAEMKHFVKWMCDTDETAMQEFWRQELKGAVGPQFPHLPSRDYLPNPDVTIEQQVPLQINAGFPFTLATVIRGAWALVASQYSGSDDVVFGETLTGRDISLPGVESIIGPLNATIPIRIKIDRKTSISDYLSTVQQSMSRRTPHQHMGWQYIRRVSQDAQHACEAPTGLVIQPESDYHGDELGFPQGDAVREALHFNPYPLMVACGIHKGGFRVCVNFDSKLVDVEQMKRILAQLDQACFQLTSGLSRKIEEVSCVPEVELDQIWRWNASPPMSWDESSNILRAGTTIKEGTVYPKAVVPWVCDPRNAALLSPIGSVGELWLETTFLRKETKEFPPWLIAGSSTCPGRRGHIRSTGDLVRLQEDGNLVFVRRKDDVLAVQGHAVDTSELNSLFEQYLPQNRATVAVHEDRLLVFVEQSGFEEEGVQILSENYELSNTGSDGMTSMTSILSVISSTMATSLKKLDKFIRDSLPPYLVPFTYIVVDQFPLASTQSSDSLLSHVASNIPSQIFAQLQTSLKQAWTKSSSETTSTVSEGILRSSWAKLLRLDPEQIDTDDNFFRLGGDSVLAMKLVATIRKQGHILTVADIFQNMRLGDAAKVLKVAQAVEEQVQVYKPFSLLGRVHLPSFLSEVVQPKLANSSWMVQDVLPVTDSQAVDVRGTIQIPRTSVQYTMLYFNNSFDRQKLFRACSDLVKLHDILRTVFIEHESTFLQVVLKELDANVITHQTDKDLENSVAELCTADAGSNFQLGSSFLRLLFVEGDDGHGCLAIGLSHAQYDGVALPRILQDLEKLYSGKSTTEAEPFSSYLSQIHDKTTQDKAVEYWKKTLGGSSLSILTAPSSQSCSKSTFQHQTVDISSLPQDITTANLLIAAWSLVLSRRLQTTDITFGNITSGRTIGSTYLENVMGPCYQFTPIRIPFQSSWTARDLLKFVQQQCSVSAAYDFLGFSKIAENCTKWLQGQQGKDGFFDSVVHYQDVIEEEESILFAGSECKVDGLNPYGDSGDPLKVVSYVRGGKTHVGIVGMESDSLLVTSVLEELAGTVEELAMCREGPLDLGLAMVKSMGDGKTAMIGEERDVVEGDEHKHNENIKGDGEVIGNEEAKDDGEVRVNAYETGATSID